MTAPAVSVIMSAYNAEAHFAEAVESVLAQTFRDFELILLDDGSIDRTPEIAHGYAAKDSRVRTITRENRGLISSLNELIEAAQAPLIARMDADDICHPERLAKQVAFMAANPACGVVGTFAHRMGEDGALWPGYLYRFPETPDEVLAAIGYGTVLMHPTVMYRRDVVRAVGGYHAGFRYAEDFDLWLRMAGRTQICNIAEPLLTYRTHDEQITSRHVVEQRINTGISLHAWKMRQEGRTDPTAGTSRLPGIGEIDAFFGRAGIEKDIVGWIAPEILYLPTALRNGGVAVIESYLEHGGDRAGMWRTVARLIVTLGAWTEGLSLAGTLLRTSLPRRREPARELKCAHGPSA